jgi:hypothetical protein
MQRRADNTQELQNGYSTFAQGIPILLIFSTCSVGFRQQSRAQIRPEPPRSFKNSPRSSIGQQYAEPANFLP